MKSVIALGQHRGEGTLFQLYDIRKFFDHESLIDVLDTLHDIGIDEKVYRSWYLMNKKTRISVKTGVGITAEADVGEVVGQGTVSQVHVMACPGYEDLRVGKDMMNDGDLVKYFREVLVIREKNKKKNNVV